MTNHLQKILAATGACAAIALPGSAAADVLFYGSGTWDSDATLSSLSAPAASWSFLFVLPSSLAASTTSAISSFSYRLDGFAVAAPAVSITFFGAQDGGMFDVVFGGTLPSFSLYGNAVLSGGSFMTGNHAVFAGVNGGTPMGSGTISLVTVLVPEAQSWATFSAGLVGLATLLARRQRRAAASAAA